MAKLSLRSARSLAAGILITIGGCSEAPTTASDAAAAPQYQRIELQQDAQGGAYSLFGGNLKAEKVIGPGGGTLEIPGGHSLSFPAGALEEPTTIKARVDVRYVEVDLDPHGIQFPAGREPTLTLSYAGAGLPGVNWANRLTIIYLDSADRFLEDMRGTVDTGRKTVSTGLPHFSRYAIATGY